MGDDKKMAWKKLLSVFGGVFPDYGSMADCCT